MKCLPTCMGKRQTFYFMMVLTTSMFLVEIIVGYMTKSMALVADSFHMLSDIISLFVGFFSLKFSRKKKDQLRGNTFGWARAEVLGALINGIFLLALCFSITIEGFKRLVEPEKLEKPIFILIVGTVGLLVNLVGMCLFHGHTGHGHSHGESSHGHSHGGSSHSHNKENKKKNKRNKKTEEENKTDVLTPAIKCYNNDAVEVTIEPWNEEITKPMKQDAINTNCNGKNLEKNGSFVSVDLMPNKSVNKDDFKNEKGDAIGKPATTSGQMNMKGVYLHLVGDALGSVVVIVAALVVYFFDGKQWTLYIDPVMSIIMVVIIVQTLIPLVKQSSMILMQSAPSNIEINSIEDKLLLKFPEIQSVHEFHVWQLTDSKLIASMHIELRSHTDYLRIAFLIKEFFHDEGIHSTTIQPEYAEKLLEDRSACLFQCSSLCEEKLCCLIEYSKNNITTPQDYNITTNVLNTNDGDDTAL